MTWSLKDRYRAEIGDDAMLDGWWFDKHSTPHEAVWFCERTERPWVLSVWRDEPAGEWMWDLDWMPDESHPVEREWKKARTMAHGKARRAWMAMRDALRAYAEREAP